MFLVSRNGHYKCSSNKLCFLRIHWSYLTFHIKWGVYDHLTGDFVRMSECHISSRIFVRLSRNYSYKKLMDKNDIVHSNHFTPSWLFVQEVWIKKCNMYIYHVFLFNKMTIMEKLITSKPNSFGLHMIHHNRIFKLVI